MAIPASLQKGLKLPVIEAPMFLVSGPDLVVECCNAGVIGTFPSLNQRTTEGYRDWLVEIKSRLSPDAAVKAWPEGVREVVREMAEGAWRNGRQAVM